VTSLLLVALAYAGLGTAVFQKRADGRLTMAARWLLAPYLGAAWINSRLWTRRAPQPVPVLDGVWLGRIPNGALPPPLGGVVDACAELSCRAQGAAYASVPMLDLVVPAPEQLREAAEAIERLHAHGPLLVCCALGYSRSAASVKHCDCCAGQGFIEADVFTNKYRKPEGKMTVAGMVKVKESVKVLCKKCNGAGRVSAACSDCRGRGKAVNQKETKKQGLPVFSTCKRCSGRGYERIPSTEAYAAICQITDAITVATWEKSVKPFYDQLIAKFDIEEAWAEAQLKHITR